MRPLIRTIGIGVLILFAGVGIFWLQSSSQTQKQFNTVVIGGETVHVTTVNTPESREKGLSGRESLAPDEGMLFVFSEEGFHAFWMKDMRFSIDIIWISETLEVVDIASNVSPDTYPTSFSPKTKATYVLEVPAGFAQIHEITVGDMTVLQ